MQKPNIVLFLIDDMGWRDLTCYGSSFYETPNIDRLAKQGMRFTNAYASCPVCSPTRASMLTGRYPATIGITNWIDWGGKNHPNFGRVIDVPYLHELPLSETTIATRLKEADYQTWHVGKWHLGGEDYYPEKHGFDVNIGGIENGAPRNGYFSPWNIPNLPEAEEEGVYLTDRLTDHAVELIDNAGDKPYFLNFSHYAVHTPIQAPAELIKKYEAKAKALGLDRIDPFDQGEPFPAFHKKDQHVIRRRVQSDPVYAAMVENLDTNVGRVLDAVERSGQAENTILIFTSDNGGLSTSEGSPTCNAPLSEGKGWMYEGGTREPLIVSWPEQIEAGSVCDEPTTSTDFMPTLLEAVGLEGSDAIEGKSILPLLKGQAMERGPIFWHYPHYGNQGGTPGSSVRDGRWKLIEFFEDGRLELYDLDNDPGEHVNLVNKAPDVTQRLHQQLKDWRQKVEAKIPQPNPEYEKQFGLTATA